MGADALASVAVDEDLCRAMLGQIVNDPIFFQEFLFPDPDPRRPDRLPIEEYIWRQDHHLRISWSQFPLLMFPVLLSAAGRGVGKTEIACIQRSIQRALSKPNVNIVSVMPSEDMIKTRHMRPTIRLIEKHPLLKIALDSKLVDSRVVILKNGSIIKWEYPGAQGRGKAQADRVKGLRASELIFDEGQDLATEHVQEAAQTQLVNPEDPDDVANRAAGYRIFGVPDDDTENMFYRSDNAGESRFRRTIEIDGKTLDINRKWKLPSAAMPYLTVGRHESYLSDYNCHPDRGIWPPKYKRDFWGLWGQQAERLYPQRVRGPVSEGVPGWCHIPLPYREFEQHTRRDENGKWVETDFGFLAALLPMVQGGDQAFGIDVGPSALTVISWFYRQDGVWRWHGMLSMDGWRDTAPQCIVIDFMTGYFGPSFIGIDKGGPGYAIHDPLRTLPTFANDYSKILRGFSENEKITVGYMADERAAARATSPAERDRALARLVPETKRFKTWTMHEAKRLMLQKELWLPSEAQAPELHAELDSVAQHYVANTQGGNWKFTPQHPHFISSMQHFIAAKRDWELEGEYQGTASFDLGLQSLDDIMSSVGGLLYAP